MKFAMIHAEKAFFPVAALCRLLGVTRQGYYTFAKRQTGARVEQEMALCARIRGVHAESQERYGSPRVLRELRRQGVTISKRRVERAMRGMGLCARAPRRFRVTTTVVDPKNTVEPNVLSRDFTATREEAHQFALQAWHHGAPRQRQRDARRQRLIRRGAHYV